MCGNSLVSLSVRGLLTSSIIPAIAFKGNWWENIYVAALSSRLAIQSGP